MSTTVKPPSPLSSTTLLAEMRPALVKYFRRKTGSPEEAEDLTQDVLVRSLAHTQWKSLDEAKGYIFRTAVNRWRDHHRRGQRRGSTVEWNESVEENLGVENPLESVLMVREEVDCLLRAFEEMNERTRTVLMLIKLEQMKVATVAESLGISVSAVNKHIAKGMATMARFRKRQEWLR